MTEPRDIAEKLGEAGRVELPADHPLVKALRPSSEAIERLERLERANAAACHAARNMLIGRALLQEPPHE